MKFQYKITLPGGEFTFANGGTLLDLYIYDAIRLGLKPEQVKVEVLEVVA